MRKNDCQPNIAFWVYNPANFFLSSSGRPPQPFDLPAKKILRMCPVSIKKERESLSHPVFLWNGSPLGSPLCFPCGMSSRAACRFLSIAGFFLPAPFFTTFGCKKAALPRRLSPHILSYSPRAYSFTLSNRRFVSSNSSKCRGALARYLRSSSAMPKNSGRLK